MEKTLRIEQRISVHSTPYFYSENAALSLLKALRWPNGHSCPRCGSTNVRQVKTTRVLEALSCRECRYNFTTVADTYFHGSRLPLSKHLQFIATVALEPEASASRLARFFEWKPTTVGRHLTGLNGLLSGDFVYRLDSYQTLEEFSSAREYLEQPGVVIAPSAFESRIQQLLEPRGRKLRRRTKAKVAQMPKPKPETVVIDRFSQIQRRLPMASPSSLFYLSDTEAAYNLVESLRWENKKRACPRCDSRFVLPVKRENLRELYRCVDCQYMFNALAGTIFQGTKMPIKKFFQFFIIFNALGDQVRMQDICYVLECTFKTAGLWLARGRTFRSPEKFAFINPKGTERLAAMEAAPDLTGDPFFAFCEMKGIVVNEPHFLEFLKGVCRTPVNVRTEAS